MNYTGRHLVASQSVTEGHPDEIADQIRDAAVDAALARDAARRRPARCSSPSPLASRCVVEALALRRPIHRATADAGHRGRSDAGLTWGRSDRADVLRGDTGL